MNHYQNQGISSTSIITPLYLASGFVTLALKSPYAAVRLKSRFMRSQKQYERVFSENVQIVLWPIISKIMRKTDEVLENNRSEIEISKERFLKNWRQLTAYISVSRVLGKFNFNNSELCNIEFKKYTSELINNSWAIIYDFIMKKGEKNGWRKRSFFFDVCRELSKKEGIQGFQGLFKWENTFKAIPERISQIDDDFLQTVNKILPKQPWGKGVHLIVAEELGCHPIYINRAITKLIEEGMLYKQVNGVLFDKNNNIIELD